MGEKDEVERWGELFQSAKVFGGLKDGGRRGRGRAEFGGVIVGAAIEQDLGRVNGEKVGGR